MKTFTCIVPAYNEQEILPKTLPSLLESVKNIPGYKDRVLVVDNNSTDSTAKIAVGLGAETVFEPVNHISKARNRGALNCPEDDYLLFIDADTFLDRATIIDSLKLLDSGKVCGGGCLVKMENNSAPFITGVWSVFSRLTNLAAGAYIFCLNSAFKSVRGFSEEIFAAEDVHISSKLKKWGRKNGKLKFTILSKHSVITSDRKLKWYSNMEVLKTFIILGIMPWRLKNKEKLGFWYIRPAPKNDTNESHEVNKNNSQ